MDKEEIRALLDGLSDREPAQGGRFFEPDGELEEAVGTALRELSYREVRVLQLYYGLGSEEGRTQARIGESFGVTGSRIGQVQGQALERLAEVMTDCGY